MDGHEEDIEQFALLEVQAATTRYQDALREAGEALEWFIKNDETSDMPEDEFFRNGRDNGTKALTTINDLLKDK